MKSKRSPSRKASFWILKTKMVKMLNEDLLKKMLEIMTLKDNEIVYKMGEGNKFLVKSVFSEQKEQQGGYHYYFENLSKGRYRRNKKDIKGFGGPRTWAFILKHFFTTKKIFEMYETKKVLRILDIGCSIGFLRRILEANIFGKTNIFYYGIDIREHQLKRAIFNEDDIESGAYGDNIPTLYINHDATKELPFADKSFDVIVSFEMTKYLNKKDVKNLFSQIERILSDKGIFIYSSHCIFDNEKQLKKMAKTVINRNIKSMWVIKELENQLRSANLELKKTYGCENYYPAIKNSLKEEHREIFDNFSEIYPPEIVQAIFGFFYPHTTPTKLLVIQKTREKMESEIRRSFEKHLHRDIHSMTKIEKSIPLSNTFLIADRFITKYLRTSFLDKNEKFDFLLRKHTDIKIPKILFSEDSKAMPKHTLLAMERLDGKKLIKVWNDLKEKDRKKIIKQIAEMLKKIHKIDFDLNFFNFSIYPLGKTKSWKEKFHSCMNGFSKNCLSDKKISEHLYSKIISFLNQNIHVLEGDIEQKLLHMDMNFKNIFLKKIGDSYELLLTWDFETSVVGDKYLDVAKTENFIADTKHKKMFLKEYGVPKNYPTLSRIYTLFIILNQIHERDVVLSEEKENEILDYLNGRTDYLQICKFGWNFTGADL
ncbi:MAG: methyltransferase domain-containing protein [Candidatus Aenigmatarchaeota archaeon]|nr:MAG: methyltransferase domain-containing protein [Candidatus Aenigmarchaeota archaeon]